MYILETARTYLRRFKDDDWKDLYEYLSDESVVLYEPYGVFDEERAHSEAAVRSGDSSYYAVCLKEGGKLIGNLYLQENTRGYELGFVFNKLYHRMGYAYETSAALINYAFEKLGAKVISARCNCLNEASKNLLAKLGMSLSKIIPSCLWFRRDRNSAPFWTDEYLYELALSKDGCLSA